MGDVKAKITEVRGEDPATQLLICGGKTLKDDDPLATSVAAGGFLVLMVKKVRTPFAWLSCWSVVERKTEKEQGWRAAKPSAESEQQQSTTVVPPTSTKLTYMRNPKVHRP